MKKIFNLAVIIFLLLCIGIMATGCSVFGNEAKYTAYYAYNDGTLDKNDKLLIEGNKWLYGDNYGEISVKNGEFVLTNADDNELYRAIIDNNVLYLYGNGENKYFYTENAFEEHNLSFAVVYATAKEAGFNGTLEELIAAFKGDSAYDIAVKKGYTGTERDWLNSLKGATGNSPRIGENGNWFIGDTDTGVCASGIKGDAGVGIKSIVLSGSDGNVDIYTILLTDGKTFNFSVTNGKDGKEGETESVTFADMYEFAVQNGFNGTYIEFIERFCSGDATSDNKNEINKMFLSSVSIAAAMSDDELSGSSGSGIIYKLDKNVGTAFIITNYHVIYNAPEFVGDADYCDTIKVYLYGSEINNGIDNDMGIEAQFIGGSQYYDIAVLKITENEFLKNSIACQAEIENSNNVFANDSVYAVGNAEGSGIAITNGIISKDSENIAILSLDETEYISRRVIRTDAPVNPGNSGGGLFSYEGKVIGIISAKLASVKSDGIGYAIPSNVAVAVANNIMKQYSTDPEKVHCVHRPIIGITIYAHSSMAVFDEEERIYVKETVMVKEITPGGLADGKILAGDIIKSVKVNDGDSIEIDRVYKIVDTAMTAWVGDKLTFTIERTVDGVVTEIVEDVFVTADCMIFTE